MSSNEKSLFRSCRQVGLRRKSVGFTPPTSTSQRVNLSMNIANDTQNNSLDNSENLESNLIVNSSSSSVEQSQPTVKRRKHSAPRRILATSKTKEHVHSTEIEPHPPFSEDASLKSSSNDALQSYHDLDFEKIQLQIDQIRRRIDMKQTQIIDLESQLVNAKQVFIIPT